MPCTLVLAGFNVGFAPEADIPNEATGQAASGLLGEADRLAEQARTLQTEVRDFLATVRAA